MSKREIIIADGDARYRSQVTDFFTRSNYRVVTADSIEQVLASVQENKVQVLLLGSGFSTKISAADLVRLLKKCSRRLHIIMVSDGMTFTQVRQVRQEGIFYQALKPATASDTEELWQAVVCAFERQRAKSVSGPAASLQGQPLRSGSGEKNEFDRILSRKALPWIIGTFALFLSASCYLLTPPAQRAHNGTSLASWGLLVFSALVVIGQLLPIFRVRLMPGLGDQRHAWHTGTSRGGN